MLTNSLGPIQDDNRRIGQNGPMCYTRYTNEIPSSTFIITQEEGENGLPGGGVTFGFTQQRGDAVLVGVRLSQLHQRQEEALQGVVEGLQQSEAQSQALYGHIWGRETEGHTGLGQFADTHTGETSEKHCVSVSVCVCVSVCICVTVCV